MLKSQIKIPNTFLYFAYGSNLYSRRILMHNTTAEFVCIARLENYRLDFIRYSKLWGGPIATLVPTANAHVWGVIWRLASEDLVSLDSQKGVAIKQYYIKYLTVQSCYMGSFICRTYIQKINPLPRGDRDPIPLERWPSSTYKKVLIRGAIEHKLPDYYIRYLRRLKDNGDKGSFRMIWLLYRYARDPPCECKVPGVIPRIPMKLDLKARRKNPSLKIKKKVVLDLKTKVKGK